MLPVDEGDEDRQAGIDEEEDDDEGLDLDLGEHPEDGGEPFYINFFHHTQNIYRVCICVCVCVCVVCGVWCVVCGRDGKPISISDQ